MKKFIIGFVIVVLLLGGGTLWWYSSNKDENNTQGNVANYNANRTSANENTNSNTTNTNNNTNITTHPITIPKKETEIATFSTTIYNKDPERQNNISITCKAVNTKEVAPGETFSFCDIVGKSTTDKGYQEADIYVDGKKEQGLGGGNCQVSTTLFNAVSQVPELEVVERHQHSGHVPYVQEGQDAAVSYGAYDFKFKNNSNGVIRIIMENTPDAITTKLIKIQ